MFNGDIARKTRAIIDRLNSVLKSADCAFSDVVKCIAWLTDVDNFKAFNATYFDGASPARSAVCSGLLLLGAKLEIEAICHKPLSG